MNRRFTRWLPALYQLALQAFPVSFEFDVRPVLTHRGTVTASSYGNLVARAMKEAQKVLRPVNARSMVCVLLERVPAAGEVIEPELEGA